MRMKSPWTTVAIGIVLAAILIVSGKWNDSLLLALLLLFLIAAIFPPAGVTIGGLALLYVILVHGRTAIEHLNLNGGKK